MRHLSFGTDESIGTLPARAAERLPGGTITLDTPSVLDDQRRRVLDYGELAQLVAETSAALHAAGVRRDDRVAIVKANHFDITALAFAAAHAGAVPALLSAAIPAEHTATMLARLQPRVIVADAATIGSWDLISLIPRLGVVVVALDADVPGAVSFDALRGAPLQPANPRHPDEPMAITHTSGTTGVPKLVAHSAVTLAHRARAQTRAWPVASLRARDRVALAIPWNHARALDGSSAVLHVGCPMLALGSYDPVAVRPHLEAFAPTIVETLPNAYLTWERIAHEAPHAFARTRMFVNAFDAIHPRTVRALLGAAGTRLPVWAQAYGQSEAGGITAALYTRRTVAGDRPALRNMGRALPGTGRIRVVDRITGEPLPRGQVGQFEVASPGLALTYVGQDELHTRRLRGGWWTMGDIGTISATGRVDLHDREIDLVPGLESCLEVEDRLLDALPDATEVVVVGVHGRAVPVVCTAGDRPLDELAWRRAVAAAGDPPLAPVVHLRWDDVPRTATLKVRRSALAERLAAITDRSSELVMEGTS